MIPVRSLRARVIIPYIIAFGMWRVLSEHFDRYPSQRKVALLLVKHGLSVHGGKAYCGDIKLSDSAMARAAGVDRRIVRSTIEGIESDEHLQGFFSKLIPTSLLKDAASVLGWSSLEIIPDDARAKGILADVAAVMRDHGISIRQALVDDPELTEEPHLYIVTDATVSVDLIPKLKACTGVRSIIIN